MRTKEVAYWKRDPSRVSADEIKTVPTRWLVSEEPALVRAAACFADLTRTASRKNTPLGVAAELGLLKVPTETVCRVSFLHRVVFITAANTAFFFTECNGYMCGQGAICIVTNSGPTCKCPPGEMGNPFPGGSCVTDQCSANRPCIDPQVCINGRCKHKCDGVVCGIGATCDGATGKCVCEPFFVGNPEMLCMPREYQLM